MIESSYYRKENDFFLFFWSLLWDHMIFAKEIYPSLRPSFDASVWKSFVSSIDEPGLCVIYEKEVHRAKCRRNDAILRAIETLFAKFRSLCHKFYWHVSKPEQERSAYI